MKGLKKKRRIQVVLLAGCSLALTFVILWNVPKEGFNYFRSPSEVVESPPPSSETFRIGGLVEEGSLKRGQGETVRFRVTDGGESVEVHYRGVLPDLFEENQGMVGTGKLEKNIFVASEILAKHDETYMPREVMDALKEQGVYQEPNGS